MSSASTRRARSGDSLTRASARRRVAYRREKGGGACSPPRRGLRTREAAVAPGSRAPRAAGRDGAPAAFGLSALPGPAIVPPHCENAGVVWPGSDGPRMDPLMPHAAPAAIPAPTPTAGAIPLARGHIEDFTPVAHRI